MLYKLTEWQGATGRWYCGCVDALGSKNNVWWLPAKILDITPAAFIELVVNTYGADNISFNKDTFFFSFSWSDQNKERKYKNFINAAARKKNFQI